MAAKDLDTPWYLIIRKSRVIRVYHGALDRSWWNRARTHGESMVWKIESVIRDATGLRRVARKHVGSCVDFELSAKSFDQAAVAVMLSFKCLAETDPLVKRMLSHDLPAPRVVKPAKLPKAKSRKPEPDASASLT